MKETKVSVKLRASPLKLKKREKSLGKLTKKKRGPTSIQSEVKRKLQLTAQKYKKSQENTMNMLNWTI